MTFTEDKMDSLFPISVEFVPGEQPSDEKLTGFAAQTEAAFATLESMIGDPWDDQIDNGEYLNMLQRPSHIANITRLIGPASALNPYRPSLYASTPTATIKVYVKDIPAGVHQFNLLTDCNIELPFTHTDDTNTETSLFTRATMQAALATFGKTAFTSPQNLIDVNSTGDYHVDDLGNVYTYTATSDYSADLSSYSLNVTPYPDNYFQATGNVIPDPGETIALCAVTDAGSYQLVTLPTAIDVYGLRGASDNPLEPGDPLCLSSSHQGKIPYPLDVEYNAGDIIPEGFIRIWDETTNEFVSGLTIAYHSLNAVRVTPENLTIGTNRYRIITAGSTITETLATLKRRFELHNHTPNGGYTRPLIHANLVNTIIPTPEVNTVWGITVSTLLSDPVEGDDHPQYFCRYGWKDNNGTKLLYDNAILGDIFLASTQSAYTSTNYYDAGASNKIYFGSTDTYMHMSTMILSFGSATVGFYHSIGDLNGVAMIETGTGLPVSFYHNASIAISHWDDAPGLYFDTGANYGALIYTDTYGFTFGALSNDINDAVLQAGSILLHGNTSNVAIDSVAVGAAYNYITIDPYDDALGGYPAIRLHDTTGTNSYLNIWVRTGTEANLSTSEALRIASGTSSTITSPVIVLQTDNSSYIKLTSDTANHTAYCDMADLAYCVMPNLNPAVGSTQGAMYYDTTTDRLMIYCGADHPGGAGWKTVASS